MFATAKVRTLLSWGFGLIVVLILIMAAAIEAARAGDQGRGFAVVADEVRKLAERTTRSTQEISLTIGKIVDGTKQAVLSMASGVEQASLGSSLAQQAGSSIVDIESEAGCVASVINDISGSLQAQTAASHDIARNVEHIAAMVEENNAAAAKAAVTAMQLEQLAQGLTEAIGSFRL